MRNSFSAAAILCLAANIVFAQTPNQPNPGAPSLPGATQPGNPTQPGALNPSGAQTQSGVQTSNQFGTEAQARSKIEADGFSNLTDLRKETDGRWTARATKAGKTSRITLDANGRITEMN